MKKLLLLGALLLLSALLYLAVFSLVHRPLVVGETQRQLDFKLSYARQLPSPKVVIFAGSNGRYSHRCEDFSRALGRPCANMSIAVGLGLDFLLEQVASVLNQGDLVYMPLEFAQYRFSDVEMHSGIHNAFLVHYQKPYLRTQSVSDIVAAYASFDLPFLIDGTVEMGLSTRGFRRRVSTDSLTAQGDEQGHTAEAGSSYREYLRTAVPDPTTVPESSHARDVLTGFLRNMRSRGVTVVGGLPTLPATTAAIESADLTRLRALYEGQGQRWLALPNLSRYPPSCFYDALYHLHEGCQREHSRAVADALAAAR